MAKKAKSTNANPSIAPARSRKIVPVPGADVPTYYVNSVSIDVSSYDVRMKLGQIQGGTTSAVEVKEVAYVFMSHLHFKALSRVMSTTLPQVDGVAQKMASSVGDPTTD